jgi:hypothetical protein
MLIAVEGAEDALNANENATRRRQTELFLDSEKFKAKEQGLRARDDALLREQKALAKLRAEYKQERKQLREVLTSLEREKRELDERASESEGAHQLLLARSDSLAQEEIDARGTGWCI